MPTNTMPAPSGVDPALLAQYAQYFDPSAFNVPKGAGSHTTTKDSPFAFAGHGGFNLDPSSLILNFLGIGGSKQNTFNPYVDAQGNYVFAPPSERNPVPVSNVPGASLAPGQVQRSMANQIQAIVNLLPYYSQAISGQVIPQAQAQLAAQEATSPGLANLMTQLYGTYGPQLNEIGNQINRTNALAQVGTDTAALEQAKGTLIPAALAAAKQYDPEYFATRQLASSRLGDLLNNINLTAGLSPTENREISQGLAQTGTQRGTYNAPSILDTVSNAMTFGNAGFQRLQANRSALSNAIGNATSALPAFKSGTDVFQVATGKPSVPNPGAGQFTGVNSQGVNNASNLALGIGTGLGSNTQNTFGQQLASNTTLKINQKDWADYLNQVTSSIGSIAGGVAGFACWIARKVYGENNPKWIQFREWLFNKAPISLREFYLTNGEYIASIMTDEHIKQVKPLMETILQGV